MIPHGYRGIPTRIGKVIVAIVFGLLFIVALVFLSALFSGGQQ